MVSRGMIWIALLRGINVGGNNKLPMMEWVVLLEGLGARGIRTYIQSGNAVFRHRGRDAARLAGEIGAAIGERFGFEPRVMLRDAAGLARVIADNPFPEAESEPNKLCVYFLEAAPAQPNLDALEAARKGNERFALKGDVFYLHAPDGLGRSKLAERVERSLGVAATARNWRTIGKIMAMAGE